MSDGSEIESEARRRGRPPAHAVRSPADQVTVEAALEAVAARFGDRLKAEQHGNVTAAREAGATWHELSKAMQKDRRCASQEWYTRATASVNPPMADG